MTPPAEQELLACPFCGGEAILDDVSGFLGNSMWSPACQTEDCILWNGKYATQREAIAAWNRRTPTPSLSEEEAREFRPALEIEITPAMIDAGARLLRFASLRSGSWDGDEELARDVFQAMLSASGISARSHSQRAHPLTPPQPIQSR